MAQEVNADGLVPVTDACVGESLYVNTYKAIGIVKYVGTTDFSKGIWIGLELDEPIGKNDGSVQGKHYFPCRPHHGVFVRETACFRLKSTTKSSSSATKVSDIVQEARPGVVSSPELPTVPSEIVRPPLPPPPLNHLNTVQIFGSLSGPEADASDSSDEDNDDTLITRPISPPLQLSMPVHDDSEGELEICLETQPTSGKVKDVNSSVPSSSSTVGSSSAMEAYLAAQAALELKANSNSLVSAMESSVNMVIGDSGKPFSHADNINAFGEQVATPQTTVNVTSSTEPDVFGILYKPFNKTIKEDREGPPKRAFEDEEEFERELSTSSVMHPSKSAANRASNTDEEDDEFDFENNQMKLAPQDLRKTLELTAATINTESPIQGVVESNDNSESHDSNGDADSLEAPAESPSTIESRYDPFGTAKDALQAIVDVYGCGLGDQEIVIMNSFGADALLGHVHGSSAQALPVSLGRSVVPGTGSAAIPQRKGGKRSSGSRTVKEKVERDTIVEEDEDDYEQREKELEVAKTNEELKAQLALAQLESEWQGLEKASPGKPGQIKSITGKSSPMAHADRNSPMKQLSKGDGADDTPTAFQGMLDFFKSQDLTQYHSMIVTSIEPSKSSWLLGGSTRLNFEGSEDELKLCFSIAQVNYDPVRYREHFSALKTIYKFFVPSNKPLTPSPGSGASLASNSRLNRPRDVGMVGEHWGNIGFQGLDPCTDINRSMKMLSVLQVIHLIEYYPDFALALHRLSHAVEKDAKGGTARDLTWPFFCVSIGFTKHALQTMRGNSLNKRCNKHKSVLFALNEYYRACFWVFARDLIAQSTVHHAVHLSNLKNMVESSPMNVLKAFKTHIKKFVSSNPGATPAQAICSILIDHEEATGSTDRNVFNPSPGGGTLEVEKNLEFSQLDDIKDGTVDKRSSSPSTEKGFSLFSRKRGYEAK